MIASTDSIASTATRTGTAGFTASAQTKVTYCITVTTFPAILALNGTRRSQGMIRDTINPIAVIMSRDNNMSANQIESSPVATSTHVAVSAKIRSNMASTSGPDRDFAALRRASHPSKKSDSPAKMSRSRRALLSDTSTKRMASPRRLNDTRFAAFRNRAGGILNSMHRKFTLPAENCAVGWRSSAS